MSRAARPTTAPLRPRNSKGGQFTRGQVLVEFTIALFFVFTMIFGIIEFGRALFAYDLVTNAARMGSRWAMVNSATLTPATLTTYVLSVSNGIDKTQLTAVSHFGNTSSCTTSNGAGCTVAVTVAYTFKFVWRFAPIAMSSTSTEVISE